MKRVIIITCILLIFFIICQLSIKNREIELEKNIDYMVKEYITNEYKGNKEYLSELSGEILKEKIRNNEITFSSEHKLDKILSVDIVEKSKSRILVRAIVSSYDPQGYLTNYYEFITIEKINDEWMFMDIERDQ